ncbi:hypothetical protein [Paenibacillus sp. 1_12]|uniref:hypothetical protein n=1 Tax=Paenibacillus sp. 1_12 TaxID=1566278 RepID=UPI0011600EFA|nr:hypothetical protein [Paenibacillus sp. 1_12]
MERIKPFYSEMHQMAQVLGEYGISLAVHPLWFNYECVDGMRAVDTVTNRLPELGLTVCFHHVTKAEEIRWLYWSSIAARQTLVTLKNLRLQARSRWPRPDRLVAYI